MSCDLSKWTKRDVMTNERALKKYQQSISPLVPVNPGKVCVDLLLNHDIDAKILPTHENVVKFMVDSEIAVHEMDDKTIGCVLKEITLLNRNVNMKQTKSFISRNRKKIQSAIKLAEKIQDSSSNEGTLLRVAAQKNYIDTT